VQKKEVDIAAHGEAVEEFELTPRESRDPKDRQAHWQINGVRVGGDMCTGCGKRFDRVGLVDVLAYPPPELGLPAVARFERPATGVLVAAGAPCPQHVGPVGGVAVEQHCQVLHGTQTAGAVTVARLHVSGQRSKPRLRQRTVDDLEQRPEQAPWRPRVPFRINAGGDRDRLVDKPAR
jgi:hypothetical protein